MPGPPDPRRPGASEADIGAHHHHGEHGGQGDGHGHAHAHAAFRPGRAFAIGIALNTGFVAAEAAFGLIADSTALLADAGHNLSDVLGLAVSWGAIRLARRAPTARFTYGFRASSILAALFNGVVLLVACGALLLEAGRRLFSPVPVQGDLVAMVAVVGIAVNLATALLFARGARGDINVRGAFLHMAADAAVSAGVAVSGFAIARTGLSWIDPAMSLVVIAVILAGTWGLLREALALAMHAVPSGIDPGAVRTKLLALRGVSDVHHLHIWPMSTTEAALTAHLVVTDAADETLLADGARCVEQGFGIVHCTFQVECAPGNGAAAAVSALQPASCGHE